MKNLLEVVQIANFLPRLFNEVQSKHLSREKLFQKYCKDYVIRFLPMLCKKRQELFNNKLKQMYFPMLSTRDSTKAEKSEEKSVKMRVSNILLVSVACIDCASFRQAKFLQNWDNAFPGISPLPTFATLDSTIVNELERMFPILF